MISPINSALSGLKAASTRIAVGADNIANQNSKNYTPKRVDQLSQENGGIRVEVKDSNNPTVTVYNPSDPNAAENGTVELPNVDVANELVNNMIASYDFKANLKSIKAADEIQKRLLDIIS